MALSTKAADLMRRIRGTQAEVNDLIESLEAELRGEATPGQQAKSAVDHYGREWERRYKTKYVPSYAKEIAACKRMLKGITAEELTRRMTAFLQANDAFYVQAKHPIGLFESNLNRFSVGTHTQVVEEDLFGAEIDAAAVGCDHVPACRTDSEHTRRSNRELRGR